MILLEDVGLGDVRGRETRRPVGGRSLQAGDAVEEDVAIPFREVGRHLIGQSARLRPAPFPVVSTGQHAENERGDQSPHT